jgi:hypothetical protein
VQLRYQKKTVVKEDGRTLIYYHFAQTATADQSEAFAGVATAAKECTSDSNGSSPTPTSASAEADV